MNSSASQKEGTLTKENGKNDGMRKIPTATVMRKMLKMKSIKSFLTILLQDC